MRHVLHKLRFEVVGVLPFAALVVWSLTLLAVRLRHAGSGTYLFLAWNLFLALIPLAASTLLRLTHEEVVTGARRRTLLLRGCQALLFAVWLLFLPNAPYLVTDLFHLGPKAPVPLWFDLALLLSCAVTGIAVGFRSMGDVHEIVRQASGRVAGWGFVVVVWFACAYGIYLGRYLRWNSWDVLHRPLHIVKVAVDSSLDPHSHPRVLGVTLLYGVLLLLTYVAVRGHVAWVAAREVARRPARLEHG
ncbi:MAG: DUF1361 domain-containing protein [Polyangiaceae bacterium]|nr:DUF1361 domain-containing protein [Polyangiaceae bacterium]